MKQLLVLFPNATENAIEWLRDHPLYLVLVLVLAIVALTALMLAFAWWRNRVSIRALRTANGGNVEGAIALVQSELSRRGPTADLCSLLALLRVRQDNFEEAWRSILDAESLNPKLVTLHANKGLILMHLGRNDEALEQLSQAILSLPRDPMAHCNLGILLVRLGREEEAVPHYRRAAEIIRSTKMFPPSAKTPWLDRLDELRRSFKTIHVD